MFRKAQKIRKKGISYTILRGIEYIISKNKIINEIYWSITPSVLEYIYSLRYREYDAPLNPLLPIEISPKRINRRTGRARAHEYMNRRKFFGKVLDGNWDRSIKSADGDFSPPVLQGDRFENTIFYNGIEQRYLNGEEWESTALYQSLIEYVERPNTSWRSISNTEEIEGYLHSIDEVYNSIAEEGYKNQVELAEENKTNRFGVLDLLTHEITVDIGRNGDFLMVDGNHRLAIAKILDLERIPVTVLVRHRKWMEYRDEVWNDPDKDASWHPDLIQPE